MTKLKAALEWLNAVPGRKRGLAAILLGISAALRALGHLQWAEGLEQANTVAQEYLVPGMDMAGFLAAVWGLGHAVVRKPDSATEAK